MMKYEKGNKVEVLCKLAVPGSSWRCAEIIYGNRNNYTVRYDMAALGEPVLQRVSGKLIRPCPPPVQIFENWIPGDVVEVLCDYSWKMATVSKVLGGNHLMVRLLGSANEFMVSKIDVRHRQSWTNGKWIIVGQVIFSIVSIRIMKHCYEVFVNVRHTAFQHLTLHSSLFLF